MASRNVSVRLAVVDGQKVKAELTEVGEAGQKALGQIERGARPASAGLDQVARAAHGAGQAAPALGNLSHAMAGFMGGIAAGAVGAGLAALSQIPQALGAIVRAGMEGEESQRRLEAVLRATGNTAGLTAGQIIDFAEAQEAATLDGDEAITNAAAVLATFKSVSGDTFTTTISLAQDLAAVFGGDLSSNVTRLGKALEDPIEGLGALRRVGVSFTDEQKELIKTLEDTGRHLEAQQVILAAVAGQVGGSASAQQTGVTGAVNALSDAWGDFLKALGQTETVTSGIPALLENLARGIGTVTDYVTGQANSIEAQFQRAKEHLAFIKQQKEENPIRSAILMPGAEGLAQRKVDELAGPAQQSAAITASFESLEKRFAAEAEERHQTEIKINAVVAERAKLEEQIGKLQKDSGERLAQVQAELATTRTRLENQRTPETSEGVDRAIAAAEEVARRKAQLIEDEVSRTQAAEARKGESAARAAERAAEANARAADRKRQEDARFLQEEIAKEAREMDAVQTLEDAYSRMTSTQISNIDLVLQRQLEANAREIENIAHREAADIAATRAAEEEKRKLTDTTLSSLHKEAISAQISSRDAIARDPTQDEAARTAAMREGTEMRILLEYEETAARLAHLQTIGLAQADYDRAQMDLLTAHDERIREIRAKAAREAEDNSGEMEKLAVGFTRTMSSGLTELVLAGQEGFDSLTDAFQTFLDGMQRQLIQTGIEAAIGSPSGGAGGGGSGILGLLFGAATTAATSMGGGGGMAAGGGGSGGGSSGGGSPSIQGWNATWAHTGSPGVAVRAPAELWRGAPRYHSGYNPPSLAPWERAAIITKDETVSTPAQEAAKRAPINVTINNNSSEPVNARDDGRGGMQIDIGTIVANAMSKPGSPAHQTLRGMIQSEMRSGG